MSDKEIAVSFYFKKVKTKDEYESLKKVTKNAIKNMRKNFSERNFSLLCENMHGMNINDMSFSEKMQMAHDVDEDKIVCAPSVLTPEQTLLLFDGFPDLDDLTKASVILELVGFESLAHRLRAQCGEQFARLIMSEKLKNAYEKKIISEDRSKAKKGKTNRHYKQALHIAKTTWEKYPNASLPGLAAEIYAYLRNKWNDVPVVGTIERWLKESGLNPEAPTKNRAFRLIISERKQI